MVVEAARGKQNKRDAAVTEEGFSGLETRRKGGELVNLVGNSFDVTPGRLREGGEWVSVMLSSRFRRICRVVVWLCFVCRVEKSTCAEVENARDELAGEMHYTRSGEYHKRVSPLSLDKINIQKHQKRAFLLHGDCLSECGLR